MMTITALRIDLQKSGPSSSMPAVASALQRGLLHLDVRMPARMAGWAI